MIPPCRPGRRVSRSQRRAACQRRAAFLREGMTQRTAPATLSRQTGQGARVVAGEKPGKTAKIESTKASGVAAQPAGKRSRQGTFRLWQETGLANFGEVGEALDAIRRVSPASAGMQTR